jgi:hypothetical protein
MKYLDFIFENEIVQQTVVTHDDLISFSSQLVINKNIQLESFIYDNLEDYISEDLHTTYESIRNFVIQENLNIYNYISEVLSDSELTHEDKYLLLESLESVTHLFGAGAKKAAKIAVQELRAANPTQKITSDHIVKHLLQTQKHASKGVDHGVLKKMLNGGSKEVINSNRIARKLQASKTRSLPTTKEAPKTQPTKSGLKDVSNDVEQQAKWRKAEQESHGKTKAELAETKEKLSQTTAAAKKNYSELSSANMRALSAGDKANKEALRAAAATKSAKNWRTGTSAATGVGIGTNIHSDQKNKQLSNELQKSKQEASNLASESAKNKKIAGIGKFGLYKHQD